MPGWWSARKRWGLVGSGVKLRREGECAILRDGSVLIQWGLGV